MMQDEYTIRTCIHTRYFHFVIATAMIIVAAIQAFDNGSNSIGESQFLIFLAVLIFWLMFLINLFDREVEITLNKYGIDFKTEGLFSWDMIRSFSTVDRKDYENEELQLILHFHEFADSYFTIDKLEKNKEEIVELIMHYKGDHNIFYEGHKVKT